jgi:hypothetical protein
MIRADDDARRARRDAELWLSNAGVRDAPAMLRVFVPGGLRS